jgi:hypothetical protein
LSHQFTSQILIPLRTENQELRSVKDEVCLLNSVILSEAGRIAPSDSTCEVEGPRVNFHQQWRQQEFVPRSWTGGPLKPGFGLSGDVHWFSKMQQHTLADALKSLKQGVSRRLIGDADHFWQKRYYDFNIRNYPQFVEKLRYIHRNPVKLDLCERPEDWEWSSFRYYATGCEGRVEIESEWTHENANERREDFVQR